MIMCARRNYEEFFLILCHVYIMRSHMLCPGYAEECEKPHGPPLNQQHGHVPHAKYPFAIHGKMYSTHT